MYSFIGFLVILCVIANSFASYEDKHRRKKWWDEDDK